MTARKPGLDNAYAARAQTRARKARRSRRTRGLGGNTRLLGAKGGYGLLRGATTFENFERPARSFNGKPKPDGRLEQATFTRTKLEVRVASGAR